MTGFAQQKVTLPKGKHKIIILGKKTDCIITITIFTITRMFL